MPALRGKYSWFKYNFREGLSLILIFVFLLQIAIPLNATPAMEKIEEQFANLNIVRRSSGTKELTYLLGIDTSKTAQAEKGSLVAVLCSNGSIQQGNRDFSPITARN